MLEWLDGRGPRSGASVAALKLAEAVEVARQAALGLDALHDAGIVHRDVKPSNFFVLASRDDSLHVKLIDLGIARGAGEAALTVEGWAVGTPAYMSPEQARGEHDVSPRSDLFSLGVVLFELLAGRRPFRAGDNYAVAGEDCPRGRASPGHDWSAGVSHELDEMVARAMAKRAGGALPHRRGTWPKRWPSPGGPRARSQRAPTGDMSTAMMRAPDFATRRRAQPARSTLQEQRVVATLFASQGAVCRPADAPRT